MSADSILNFRDAIGEAIPGVLTEIFMGERFNRWQIPRSPLRGKTPPASHQANGSKAERKKLFQVTASIADRWREMTEEYNHEFHCLEQRKLDVIDSCERELMKSCCEIGLRLPLVALFQIPIRGSVAAESTLLRRCVECFPIAN